MRIDEFIEQFNGKYPDVDRFDVATDEMITIYEETLGYRLPVSFVKFLKEFSNGFFYWIVNPLEVLVKTLHLVIFAKSIELSQTFLMKF